MKIRPALPHDAAAIAHVEVTTWRATYSGLIPESVFERRSLPTREKLWASVLTPSAPHGLIVFVAESESAGVIGFCDGGRPFTPVQGYDAEIVGIYVLPAHQRAGTGRALLRSVAREIASAGAQSIFLWALKDNVYRSFYEKLGGVITAEQLRDFGAPLACVAYGWPKIDELVARSNPVKPGLA